MRMMMGWSVDFWNGRQEAGGQEDEDSAPDAAANFCRFFNFNFSLKCPSFSLSFRWFILLCLHLKQLAR